MVVQREQGLSMALSLSRRALELLDAFDEPLPAVHLQRAIDAMTGAPVPGTAEEAEAMLDRPENRALRDRFDPHYSAAGRDG